MEEKKSRTKSKAVKDVIKGIGAGLLLGGVGALMLAPIASVITGAIMMGVNKSKLQPYQSTIDTYQSSTAITEFVEDKKDEDEITMIENEQVKIVLSENAWNRLKNLYQETVVVAKEKFETGEITTDEYKQVETSFCDEFRHTVTMEEFVTINNGEGVIKEYNRLLNLSYTGSLLTLVGASTLVLEGGVIFLKSIMEYC